jgi:hypothetical protein
MKENLKVQLLVPLEDEWMEVKMEITGVDKKENKSPEPLDKDKAV